MQHWLRSDVETLKEHFESNHSHSAGSKERSPPEGIIVTLADSAWETLAVVPLWWPVGITIKVFLTCLIICTYGT